MQITCNFHGGNLTVLGREGNVFHIAPDLRDTTEPWFYWAFCVIGAAGKTLTFDFGDKKYIGYYGPAVSYDMEEWQWLGGQGDNYTQFSYTFKEGEDRVFFAHDMVYLPRQFESFAEEKGIEIQTLCLSRRSRPVPFVQLGDPSLPAIVLAARHHACESPGSYVLEGFLTEYLKRPIPATQVFCVPFMDYDGVLDGDQGKCRAPHDHNRDYTQDVPSIYSTVAAMRRFVEQNTVHCAIDFHAPCHFGGKNDTNFIVHKNTASEARTERFCRLLMGALTANALHYDRRNDIPPDTDWNKSSTPTFANYIYTQHENALAFTMETAYFGTADSIFSRQKAVAYGRCVCRAAAEYLGESTAAL